LNPFEKYGEIDRLGKIYQKLSEIIYFLKNNK